MKIKLLILFFITLLPNITHAEDYPLEKVCEPDLNKKTAFYESTKKMIQANTKLIKKESAAAKEFVSSFQYQWLRFAISNGLPVFGNPGDSDDCGTFYEQFVTEGKPIAARDKLIAWKSCLVAQYKEELPAMAKKLLECHEQNNPAPVSGSEAEEIEDATLPAKKK